MAEDNVIPINCGTTLDIPVEKVLNGALKAELDVVILVGSTSEGELYFASSSGDETKVLWLIEKAKKDLLDFQS